MIVLYYNSKYHIKILQANKLSTKMMEPMAPPKSIIEQLNAFCQADVKTQWTAKRLHTSPEVCGFSYVENAAGEWLMMPTLCQNCQQTMELFISGDIRTSRSAQTNEASLSSKTHNTLVPSPLTPQHTYNEYEYNTTQDESRDYLLYTTRNNSNDNGLAFYRPSLASNGCCQIL
jgi:hypothetical protein